MFLLSYIFVFFFCTVALFLNVLLFIIKVITHSFLFFFLVFPQLFFSFWQRYGYHVVFFLLLSCIFKCFFCSSPRLSCIAFFLFFLVILQIFFFIDIKVIMLFFSSFAVICFQMFLVKSSSSS